jgi:ATP-binding cassette subfamily C protein LapB
MAGSASIPTALICASANAANRSPAASARAVAIARALVQDPSILLLDEPTGAMDNLSEESIKRELGRIAAGKTLLLVTHRTSLLDLVDRIIVIDQGKLVADGPKAQVIEALRQGRIGKAA